MYFPLFSPGLTFVEMVMVLVSFSVVIGILLFFILVSRESLTITTTKTNLQQDLRRCLLRIEKELAESSMTQLTDSGGSALNLVQRDDITQTVKCLPVNEECVYTTVKFKIPTAWDNNGQISSWSDYITYTMSSNQITRQVGTGTPEVLVNNITLVTKPSGHGYTYDPNEIGSGFERLSADRLKISLVAQRTDYKGRTVQGEIGSIVYLRN
jgi:type II secretory pathway component PulJ